MSGYQRLGTPGGQSQYGDEQQSYPFDTHNTQYPPPQRPTPVPTPYQESLYRPPTTSPGPLDSRYQSPAPHDRYQTPHPQYQDDRYRTPDPHQQEIRYQSPPVPDNRYQSPPPGPQMSQSYQMEDRPYASHRPLDIPVGPGPSPATPGDRMMEQPTYAVENVYSSYGHGEAYNDQYAVQADQMGSHDYAFNPEDHHNAYGNPAYQPNVGNDIGQYSQDHPHYWQDDSDTRPMLQGGSFGPDPHSAPTPDPEQQQYLGGMMNGQGVPRPTPSPAPIKRWKTVKEVQLFQGNLVLDCPVPPRLLNQVPHSLTGDRDEFTHMRYTAATCDPEDFYSERFTLRQRLFAKPRHTELFIVVTMYNEADELFARTMIGIIKNIEYMNSKKSSKSWGEGSWKKIVVCVVSDGRAKINPRTRAVLAALGVYQDGIAKQNVNGKDVTAHIYEYSTQMSLEINKGIVNVKKGNTPIQMLFCLKEKNQKKINSHRWFFQAFGKVLDPNICCLIDCGTRPGRDSIFKLWQAFEFNPMCAGACGEIKAMLSHGKALINPLVAAQNFEYKISNILDKPLESVFGFISVLPGAFSAYRYIALQNDKTGQGPLEKYFKGEKMHGAQAGIFTANMYLAEDRILCFELVAKRNCHWVLQYVKSATGETDVPTEMADFIMQRRRWLNGSFFAAVYAVTHCYQVFSSGHSFLRKIFFLIEFFYQTVNMLFAWFAIGNFFLVFRILTTSLGQSNLLGTPGTVLAVIFEWLYLITLVACFVLALGNRPQGSNKLYMTMVYFWVVLMIYLMFAAVFITVKSIQGQIDSGTTFTVGLLFQNHVFFTLMVSMAATYLLYLTMSILFLDPWHMLTSFIQYLLLTPTYVNILNVYAFCNTHDVTWGTKDLDKADKLPSANTKPTGKIDVFVPSDDGDLNSLYEQELRVFSKKAVVEVKKPSPDEKQEDYYKGFRSAVVLVWIFCNLALTAVVLNTGGFEQVQVGGGTTEVAQQNSTIYMSVVLWSVAGLSAFRWVGGIWFLIVRLFRGV